MKPNGDIRKAINNTTIFTYQIANKLGIHENTFFRWMRTEMSGERKAKIMDAIGEIRGEVGREGERYE